MGETKSSSRSNFIAPRWAVPGEFAYNHILCFAQWEVPEISRFALQSLFVVDRIYGDLFYWSHSTYHGFITSNLMAAEVN